MNTQPSSRPGRVSRTHTDIRGLSQANIYANVQAPCRNLARRLGGHAWSSLPLPGLRATCVDGRFRADRQVDAYFSVLCVFQFACSHAVPSCVSTGALSYVPLDIQDFPY